MPTAKIGLPDGRIAILEVPQGLKGVALQTEVQSMYDRGDFDQPEIEHQKQPESKPSYFKGLRDTITGGAETALTMASGVIAEPVAGVAGLVQSLNPFEDEGAGAAAVESVREGMRYTPRTQEGQEMTGAVGEVIAPVGEALSTAEDWLGDTAFDMTGSPAVAAAAKTAPTAILEVLGLAAAKGLSKAGKARHTKDVDRFISQAAPDAETLKNVSRTIYKEIDDMGVAVKPDAYASLASKITRETKKAGLDKDITPAASKAVNRLNEKIGAEVTLSELDTLRKVSQGAADSINKTEKALGNHIIASIDDFLDRSGVTALTKPKDSAGVGKRYKVARDLWGRARRSELIDEAFTKADLRASGLENGIRIQFRQILNNQKKRKFFTKDEIREMDKVVKGTKGANLAKLVGRLGVSEGNATNILGGAVGGGTGAAIGGVVAGPPGAAIGAMATIGGGQLSRRLAQRITKGNAKFAQQLVRAGKNGREITRAYLANTPEAQRSVRELSQLLSNPDIALDLIGGDEFVRRAVELARARRFELGAAAASGASKEAAIEGA